MAPPSPEHRDRWKELYAHALRLDPEEGEALVHETWLAVRERIAVFELAYLLGVVRNLRRQRRRAETRRATRERVWTEVSVEADPEPLDLLLTREQRTALRAALAQLDVDDRRLVVDRYAYDTTSDVLATERSRSANTIRWQLQRVLARLELILRPLEDPGMNPSERLHALLRILEVSWSTLELDAAGWSGRVVIHLVPRPTATFVERVDFVPPPARGVARRARRVLRDLQLPSIDSPPFEMHFEFTAD